MLKGKKWKAIAPLILNDIHIGGLHDSIRRNGHVVTSLLGAQIGFVLIEQKCRNSGSLSSFCDCGKEREQERKL